MARLLIVDDEPAISWGLVKLARSLGHEPHSAATAEEGFSLAAAHPPQAIVLDVRLPGMDGLTAIGRFREIAPTAPIIVVTAYGDLQTAVEAVRQGAFEYLVKPFDLEQVERVLQRALVRSAPAAASDAEATFDAGEAGLLGRSPRMQEAFRRIALAAASQACVLIRGESGSGKELAARAVHRYSRRAGGPFVAVNVAALNPTLAESELFGHVRGAFTGAENSRAGLLAQADGGTLFLDEVADIPLPVQVKLLRALEHGEILPVGGSASVHSDFRVISATHQDLLGKVQSGEFRHDLYFRLCTFQIDLPPLRDREGDVLLLADHFVRKLSADRGGDSPGLSPAARARLEASPWYGNVRELRNAIEHALIVCRGGAIAEEHLPPPAPQVTAAAPLPADPSAALRALVRQWGETHLKQIRDEGHAYDDLLALVEPSLFAAALAASQGECSAAARRLGLHRTTLRKKLDQYGIDGREE